MEFDKNANGRYAQKEYWDERYRDEESFDWFVGYNSFQHLITKAVLPDSRILHLGCGNSPLSREMYSDGYHNILNVDYSDVVISEMQERHKMLTGMTWAVMDITDMSQLEAESFDCVLEKGTLDALLVDEKDPWWLSEDAETLIDTILLEVCRVLRPGGQFISVTFAQPHFRIPLLAMDRYGWDINTDILGVNFHYFYYTMVKGQKMSELNSEIRATYMRRKSEKSVVNVISDSEDEDFLFRSVFVCDSDSSETKS